MIGPVQQVPVSDTQTAPLYLLRFDKNGVLQSPQTAAQLLAAVAGATDVFWFSHGWNTIYDQALAGYRSFIDGFIAQRRQFDLPVPQPYRPILVGVIWPSTSLVLPWEKGPVIAADIPDPQTQREIEEMQNFVAEGLDPAATAAFSELLDGSSGLAGPDARSAADLVRQALGADTDDETGAAAPDVDDLIEAWRSVEQAGRPFVPDDPDDFGDDAAFGDDAGFGLEAVGGPAAAGVEVLDPRNLVRVGTLWKMKARAGEVGVNGVGPLLREVLRTSAARLHLIGHSFGARVLLSAMAAQAPVRPARSMLLLEPAVNRWCFAPVVESTGVPGGYRPVLDRVEQPILTTFTNKDMPLHDLFHLAVRSGHVGEPDIAAIGDTDLYGALGGYGPAGLGTLGSVQGALPPGGRRYDRPEPVKVIAIDGGALIDGRPAIGGHGDISKPVTWWALHTLAAPEQP